MKKQETLEEKRNIIYDGKKENATTKKLESLLLANGFKKIFSGSTEFVHVTSIRLEFTKGNEKIFINVTKPNPASRKEKAKALVD